jgi:hypothetical protein
MKIIEKRGEYYVYGLFQLIYQMEIKRIITSYHKEQKHQKDIGMKNK